jgi:hypothetical protein
MLFIWLGTGPVVGSCEHDNKFHNFIRVAERLLASQEGFCSLELFSHVITSKKTQRISDTKIFRLVTFGKMIDVYFENNTKPRNESCVVEMTYSITLKHAVHMLLLPYGTMFNTT